MEHNGTEHARRTTRRVRIGQVHVGAGESIAVQSMCATKTRDIDATVAQVHQLAAAGAAIVRIAVDNLKEVDALAEIRTQTEGVTLSVDLQENYRVAEAVAPDVDTIRSTPGPLHHIERSKSIAEKVAWLATSPGSRCALRIGVNRPVAPEFLERHPAISWRRSSVGAHHCDSWSGWVDPSSSRSRIRIRRRSSPRTIARRAAPRRRASRSHRGVTARRRDQDPPPSRSSSRASATRFASRSFCRTAQARRGRGRPPDHPRRRRRPFHLGARPEGPQHHLVPARVENESFVELAQQVRELAQYAAAHRITIAVMGCRVNGPGETDDADLGLWCGPSTVNLKKKDVQVGTYGYTDVLPRLREELDRLIADKA
jgi:(E)-4-hydroxy-3-methylbut-2-enyl-diphosphate synthase